VLLDLNSFSQKTIDSSKVERWQVCFG